MFELGKGDPLECREDCLVIGLQQVPKKFGGLLGGLDNRFGGALTELVKSGDLSARAGSLSVIHTLGKLPVKRLLFIGLGNPKEIRKEHLKRMFGKAVKHIRKMRWPTAAVFLDTFCTGTVSVKEAAQMLGEAVPMAAYRFAGYKGQPNIPKVELEKVAVFIQAAGKKPEPAESATQVHSGASGKTEGRLGNAEHVNTAGKAEIRAANADHAGAGGKAGGQPVKNANLQTGTYRNTGLPGEPAGTALHRGFVYGKAVNTARTLANTPVNIWTPARLAEYAASLAEKYAFELEIIERTDLEKLGMGACLAAAGKAKEPQNMIVLKYAGKQEWHNVLALVGTGAMSFGCTSGANVGMAGAAAVLGAMEVIGEQKPARNVVAVIPVAGNRITGTATNGQDNMRTETAVITSMNGKTIEMRDTGAAGLLMLADAVTYAKQYGASQIVDVATLTADVIPALGRDKTGAVANCDAFFERVLESAKEAGEFIWRLPVTEEDKDSVRSSKIADLNGSPNRDGRVIRDGAFIGEFVEDTPWAHLEITGTAITGKETDLGPAGATGVMVRTLAVLAARRAEG
ncbi:M17 family peptidase N-terminal domain-containing protein [Heyndrickxia faecalis]|uniref:M17 family peptidase N-terminal domain-containing protein n=1 Tax=Heyndrickxia TaxID=2837504 RepID=UPI002E1F1B62|nr:M17 family peptidase N-terminal domain-containing protein [Weizmannia sp. CD-2023]MED4975048.1 M17 family peptidase N-terminal domain-containing protein [Weizmannia sp. CD-2023]